MFSKMLNCRDKICIKDSAELEWLVKCVSPLSKIRLGHAKAFTEKVWEEFGVDPPPEPRITTGDTHSNSSNPEVKELNGSEHS